VKYLIIIALAGAGYYLYSHQSTAAMTIDSYQALFKKLETTKVTLQEVKHGSNMLAEFFCNDEAFQKEVGSSVSACHSKLNNYQEMCESRIFSNGPETFENKDKDKDTIRHLAKSYTACVGIK